MSLKASLLLLVFLSSLQTEEQATNGNGNSDQPNIKSIKETVDLEGPRDDSKLGRDIED